MGKDTLNRLQRWGYGVCRDMIRLIFSLLYMQHIFAISQGRVIGLGGLICGSLAGIRVNVHLPTCLYALPRSRPVPWRPGAQDWVEEDSETFRASRILLNPLTGT
jgi:hypothetical protein